MLKKKLLFTCLSFIGAFIMCMTSSAFALNILIADDIHDQNALAFLPPLLEGYTVTHVDNYVEGSPVYTDDLSVLTSYDVVIFYGSGDGSGREITVAEQNALEAYIQQGGHLISTGYDTLGSPTDGLLMALVRSTTAGDGPFTTNWTVTTNDHFIVNGPYGDFRGQAMTTFHSDHDRLTADGLSNAVGLGTISTYHKIVITNLAAPGGTVGMWNGNREASDWNPELGVNGNEQLAMLKNWLNGIEWLSGYDRDGDGTFDQYDGCPTDANKTDAGVCGCGVADTDNDGDGIYNCYDLCPNDPNKIQAGACGCGSLEVDSDGDGYPICFDDCPTDTGKVVPGICGCGTPDIDSDNDGKYNCQDFCPNDPAKVEAGACGCGKIDADVNENGVLDCFTNQELNAQIGTAITLLKRTKKATNRKALRVLMADMVNFIQSQLLGIQVAEAGADLVALGNDANKMVRKANKAKAKRVNKNKAKKALTALQNAIVQ